MAGTDATVMPLPDSAGVSIETHNQIKDENARMREQLAVMRVKTEALDAQKREQLKEMKADVHAFITELVGDESNAAYKHELQPMCRWAGEMDKADSVETNLSIGRLLSCASAKHKRSRSDAVDLSEKATLLATTMKQLDASTADVMLKTARIADLEGLVEERTRAATNMQDELARAGLVREKIDFSKLASRENVPANETPINVSRSASSINQGKRNAGSLNMDDALFAFVSQGGSGSGRIVQSKSPHHLLGSTSHDDSSLMNAIATYGR